MDQIDPQNQQVLVGGNPTRIFKNSNAGRRIMAQLHAGLGMRSMMMMKMTISVVVYFLEADQS